MGEDLRGPVALQGEPSCARSPSTVPTILPMWTGATVRSGDAAASSPNVGAAGANHPGALRDVAGRDDEPLIQDAAAVMPHHHRSIGSSPLQGVAACLLHGGDRRDLEDVLPGGARAGRLE